MRKALVVWVVALSLCAGHANAVCVEDIKDDLGCHISGPDQVAVGEPFEVMWDSWGATELESEGWEGYEHFPPEVQAALGFGEGGPLAPPTYSGKWAGDLQFDEPGTASVQIKASNATDFEFCTYSVSTIGGPGLSCHIDGPTRVEVDEKFEVEWQTTGATSAEVLGWNPEDLFPQDIIDATGGSQGGPIGLNGTWGTDLRLVGPGTIQVGMRAADGTGFSECDHSITACYGCFATHCDGGNDWAPGRSGCWCGAVVDAAGNPIPGIGPIPTCWVGPYDPVPAQEDICDDGIDNDLDGRVDCEDRAGCQHVAACQSTGGGGGESQELVCDDGADDDGDGFIDCADVDCIEAGHCGVIAGTGDVQIIRRFVGGPFAGTSANINAPITDSRAKSEDPAWWFNRPTGSQTVHVNDLAQYRERFGACHYLRGSPECTATSTNGVPTCDGTDCSWPGAVVGPDRVVRVLVNYYWTGPPVIELDCRDNVDDDGDGFRDCLDIDCTNDLACTPESSCTDTVDNDVDGLMDCQDPDCSGDPACGPLTACGGCTSTQCFHTEFPDGPDPDEFGCWCGMRITNTGWPAFGTNIPECWVGPLGLIDLCQDGYPNDDGDMLADCDDVEDCGDRPYCQDMPDTEVFARGVGLQLLHGTYGRGGWSGWRDVGGTLESAPTAAYTDDDRIDVFARGNGGELIQNTLQGGTWSGWTSLGDVGLTGPPAAVSWTPGAIDVYWRGTDGALSEMWWVEGTGWTGPVNRGGALAEGSGPAVASWGPDHIDILVRGTDDALHHRSWTAGNGFSPFNSLGGILTADPAISTRGWGAAHVFVRGGGDNLYPNYWTLTGGWSGFFLHGQTSSSAPALSSTGDDVLDVWARDHSNRLIHQRWQSPAWQNWETFGGEITSKPAAVARVRQSSPNQYELCSDGLDNNLDYLVDCADPTCVNRFECGGATFSATFDSSPETFVYTDDAFNGTSNPQYADGFWTQNGFTGGGLQVQLDAPGTWGVIQGMSGSWSSDFEIPTTGDYNLMFSFKLVLPETFENHECVDVILVLDGEVFDPLGTGYIEQICGVPWWQPWYFITILPDTYTAGTHSFELGAYLNQRSAPDEWVTLLIDDVIVEEAL